jgi:hypothetical protein
MVFLEHQIPYLREVLLAQVMLVSLLFSHLEISSQVQAISRPLGELGVEVSPLKLALLFPVTFPFL